ncbi:hypothetical protein [Desulfotignum phosphitoxidans]|nr:hypothetical protein [Desulfotignum phosphitoxidans]
MNKTDIPIEWLNGSGKPSKSATSIQMVSSVVVIVACQGLIMCNMHTKPNVSSAAMFMVQMAPICSKGAVQSAKEGHRGSGIGKSPKNKVIQTQREK